jgi:heme-degrading monooxygenase HmoA
MNDKNRYAVLTQEEATELQVAQIEGDLSVPHLYSGFQRHERGDPEGGSPTFWADADELRAWRATRQSKGEPNAV